MAKSTGRMEDIDLLVNTLLEYEKKLLQTINRLESVVKKIEVVRGDDPDES